MLSRLADLAANRGRVVVIGAAVFAVLAGAVGGSVFDAVSGAGFDDPATDSQQARKRVQRATGNEADPGFIAVVRAPGPVSSGPARERVDRVAGILQADPAIATVVTWYGSHNQALVSRDRHSTYVVATTHAGADTDAAADRVQGQLDRVPGVTLGGVQVAQAQVQETVKSDLARAELLAFPLLFLLSLWFFRSLVAALLPPLVGGLAIVTTFLVLRGVTEVTELSVFALNLVTGLGLGLAIDYSLFVVSRYREEAARSGFGREAMQRTLASAGRTVVFSSLTVAAALASLMVFPQRFLYSMGIGGSLVALIAAVVALVVLPSVLALLGPRVNALAPKRLQRAAEREARPLSSGGWYRLSRFVMRRPGLVATASATLLIALGVPFLGIQFRSVDATVLPKAASARQVEDTIDSQFPPHRSAPVYVVAQSPGAGAGGRVEAFRTRVTALPGAAAVSRPQALGDGVWRFDVISKGATLSSRSEALVRDIRALPEGGIDPLVGGQSARQVDLKLSLAGHLPLAVLIIVVATMTVLFLMTGSVVLPIKALVMNVLTLSATFGILVVVFQDGRLEGPLGYTSQGALDASQPLLLFAVAFGLSTDYGVFLLSRIKEARDAGASNSEAVATGLERTGRIITAAALLFCVAIGAFATSQIIFIKELGVGTAVAVLIDATIIRALLVPALMELLGKWNWWAPAPLRRLHRRIGLSEGPGPGATAAAAGK